MQIFRKTEISSNTHRFAAGDRMDIIVKSPRGAFYYFVRDDQGETRFVYGGESADSRPSKAVVEFAANV